MKLVTLNVLMSCIPYRNLKLFIWKEIQLPKTFNIVTKSSWQFRGCKKLMQHFVWLQHQINEHQKKKISISFKKKEKQIKKLLILTICLIEFILIKV